SRPVKTRFCGSQVYLQLTRNVLVAELVILAKDERSLILRRQIRNGSLDRARHICAMTLGVRRRARRDRGKILLLRFYPRASRLIDGQARGDGDDPWGQGLFPPERQSGKGTKKPEECFLGQILDQRRGLS